MLVCKEAARLISHSYHRPLGLGERVSLRVHLMMCKACTHFKEQVQLLHEAARRWNDQEGEVVAEAGLSEQARRAISEALASPPRNDRES